MAYVSLYRKYRPQTFDDVVGQDHVTRTLRNAIEQDRLSHAYLFTGPRGTGKTSTARILAKAINCASGPTATPCGTCGQCVAIADGTSVDVIELDMASHGGVDDARELRDRALFAPASARRKVYILDEVHMASTAAFNALLKLIEEPPAHVLFAMATTDPQKVLPTIMSRVQRLDLRRVGAPEVAALVRDLCVREGYAIDDGAVEAVVRAGDGSVRDTLSVLEQVLAYAGRDVTAGAVAQTLGTTPMERVIDTVALLADRDLAGLLAMVQGLVDEGHDLRRFTLDLVQHLRDLLVLAVAPERPDLVDATDDRRARLGAQAGLLPQATTLRAVSILAATITEQRLGSPRLPLELALAKLAVPGADGDVAELVDRIARLEASGGAAAGDERAGYRARADRSAPETAAVRAPVSPPPGVSTDETTRVPSAPPADAPPAADTRPADVPSSPAASPTARPASALASRPSDEPGSARLDEPEPEPEPGAKPGSQPEAGAMPEAKPEPVTKPEAKPGSQPEAEAKREPEPVAKPEPVAESERGTEAPVLPEARPPTTNDPADRAVDDEGAVEDEGAVDDTHDPLSVVTAHWAGILELLKENSRRYYAMIEPAVPVAASRGILTLRYGRRHASFHAVQARTGELDRALREAILQSCGLKFRIDVSIEGEDDRRRPMPPSLTPDDARTPVLDDLSSSAGSTPPDERAARPAQSDPPSNPGPPRAHDSHGTHDLDDLGDMDDTQDRDDTGDDDEGREVREAEDGAVSPVLDVDELLASELDARLVEEHPPPDASR